MARYGPNLQTSKGLVFIPKTEKLLLWHLKWKEKNINQRLGGLRMEDQGERNPQTFLVNNFSFLQPRRKQDNQVRFQVSLNTDRGFKAAASTLENKNDNVQY